MSGDDNRGLYRKYDIKRTDGSSGKGGKHEHCAYFVLDLEHDEFAIPALAAYARACSKTHPSLAADIRHMLRRQADKDAHHCHCREASCPHSLGQAFAKGASDTAHELMDKEGT